MKNILLILFCAGTWPVFAQEVSVKKFFWGVVAGIEQHRLSVQSINNKVSAPDSPAAGAERGGTAGALAGIFGRWRLTRDLAIQSELLFSLAQNKVRFSPEGVHEQYHFMDAELPLHLVLTNRAKNHILRPSLMIGGRIGWNFASNPSDRLNLYQNRTAVDIGLGAEIHLQNFHIQPEVVYSYGLNNMHNYLNTPYDPGIKSVVRDRITLRILLWR